MIWLFLSVVLILTALNAGFRRVMVWSGVSVVAIFVIALIIHAMASGRVS